MFIQGKVCTRTKTTDYFNQWHRQYNWSHPQHVCILHHAEDMLEGMEAIQKLEELKWWGQVQGFELELGATPSILRQTKEWINLEWPSREQLGDICGWKIRQELSVCVCSSESKFHPELRQRKASKSREVIFLLFSAVIASTWTIASRPWKTWIFSDRSRGGPWK